MTLLGTKVLIEQYESEPVTKGGLVLPGASKQKLPQGKVIAHGDKCHESLGQGEREVIFNAFAAQAVTIEGKPYVVIDETDILVIL